MSLERQVAIVTGAASGIGRATALALARAGSQLVLVDRNESGLKECAVEVAKQRDDGAEPIALASDVRSEADMAAMAERTLQRYGRIDALVASAGVLRGPGSPPHPLSEVSEEEWDYVLDINLKGMFLSNRAVLPAMMRQRSGNIVNLSSVSGKQGRPLDGPYSASKFGVIGMSQALAEEVRSHGVRVQVLMPDAVQTPIWEQNGPVKAPAHSLPAERVADLIAFMLAQPSDSILLDVVVAPFRSRRRAVARGGKAS